MADITYTKTAVNRKAAIDAVVGKGDSNTVKVLLNRTIEVAGTEAVNSTINFGRIPSNCRILSASRVYYDDLSTGAGAPTLDIGLASVNANITSDPDALSAGHTLTTANTAGLPALSDAANSGLPAWDLVNGQTTDPGGEFDVYGSMVDTVIDTSGTITLEILGYLD